MTITFEVLCERMRAAGRSPDRVFRHAPADALAVLGRGEMVRAGLMRHVPGAAVGVVRAEPGAPEGEGEGDGYTIEGYGAVTNSVTVINSWEGRFKETIDPGAFKKTLRDTTPRMQFDHGYHPVLGSLPMGRWTTAEEDARGMHLVGRMRQNWMVEPFAEAIREGDVDGMSFRFSVVREKWVGPDGKEVKDPEELWELLYWAAPDDDEELITRHLREVKVTEAGPVVWPAYQDTEVGARSADGGTMVLDVAALRGNRGAAAYLIATLDAELARGHAAPGMPTPRGTAPGGDPRTTWQRFGAEALARRAEDTARLRNVVHTDAVDTAPAAPARAATTEPRPTGTPAAAHPDPASAPRSTEQEPAGQHSPSDRQPTEPRPANPTDRRKALVAEYRAVLDRSLALPPS